MANQQKEIERHLSPEEIDEAMRLNHYRRRLWATHPEIERGEDSGRLSQSGSGGHVVATVSSMSWVCARRNRSETDDAEMPNSVATASKDA